MEKTYWETAWETTRDVLKMIENALIMTLETILFIIYIALLIIIVLLNFHIKLWDDTIGFYLNLNPGDLKDVTEKPKKIARKVTKANSIGSWIGINMEKWKIPHDDEYDADCEQSDELI